MDHASRIHPLHAVLRLRQAHVASAEDVLARSRRQLQARERELEAALSRLQGLQQERSQRNQAARLDLEFQRMARLWQGRLKQEASTAQAARDEQQRDCQERLAQLRQRRQDLRLIEKQRDRLARLAEVQANQQAQRQQDDSWLGRLLRRGSGL